MAESGLIAAYLADLRASVSRLPDADDIVAETEDHLCTVAEELVASTGCTRADAEARALARFGTAALVARQHVEESKRGGAVSTNTSRRAGVAAMAAPVLFAVGQAGNVTVERGAGHGVAVALMLLAVGVFAFGLWGLRARHGGLGAWGRAALWLFVASPVLALPFGWGAGIALVYVQLVVVALLGMGMLRARVLPPVPVAMFSLSAPATVATAAMLTAVGVDASQYMPLGVLACLLGYMWLGWAMWREPALDAGRPSPGASGPLAA
ncbi:MAG TPA: hypothetical protein VHF47_12505 [Acidimicrobiales bacterium]|nr:hypothetical protein [Acidimicrobiales bacterium]